MNDRFGEIAIGEGFISQLQLDEVLAIQRLNVEHVPLGRLLYDLGYICLADVSEVLAKQRTARKTEAFVDSGDLIVIQPYGTIPE